jgi:hypothetical protein
VQRLSYEETKEGLFFSNPSDSGQEIETFGLNKYSLIPKKRDLFGEIQARGNSSLPGWICIQLIPQCEGFHTTRRTIGLF